MKTALPWCSERSKSCQESGQGTWISNKLLKIHTTGNACLPYGIYCRHKIGKEFYSFQALSDLAFGGIDRAVPCRRGN
jgi:hypothetical protein